MRGPVGPLCTSDLRRLCFLLLVDALFHLETDDLTDLRHFLRLDVSVFDRLSLVGLWRIPFQENVQRMVPFLVRNLCEVEKFPLTGTFLGR